MFLAQIDWNGMAIFVAAISGLIATIMGEINRRRLNQLKVSTDDQTKTIDSTHDNVQKVSEATNGMKDALVDASKRLSFAEGHQQAVVEQTAQAAAVKQAVSDAEATRLRAEKDAEALLNKAAKAPPPTGAKP